MTNSLQVGITGGIGAGKSIVCRLFGILAIPVYDADSHAKWLMNHDAELKQEIQHLFGDSAYKNDGRLNRSLISEKVFGNPEKLQKLNQLVHPTVAIDYQNWQQEQSAPYSLKEAALLFESGSYKRLDAIIVVSAPESLRIDRVMKRDPQRTREEIKNIISRQWSEEKKIELADFVIQNDESEGLIDQVLSIHQKLLKKAR